MKWRRIQAGFYESYHGYHVEQSRLGDWTLTMPYRNRTHGFRTLREAKAAAEEHHRATGPEKGAER